MVPAGRRARRDGSGSDRPAGISPAKGLSTEWRGIGRHQRNQCSAPSQAHNRHSAPPADSTRSDRRAGEGPWHPESRPRPPAPRIPATTSDLLSQVIRKLEPMTTSPDGDLTFTTDGTLGGLHQGSVRVEAGSLVVSGTLQGSLSLAVGASATISGHQQGSVHLSPRCEVIVTGRLDGSVHVEPEATVIIAAGGRHAGSLHNDGTVIVRGVFGGSRTGAGEFRLEDEGWVKAPVMRDGVNYYEW